MADRSSNIIPDEVIEKRRESDQPTRSLGWEPEDVKVDNALIRKYIAHNSHRWKDSTIVAYSSAFSHYVEYLDMVNDDNDDDDDDTSVLTATQDHIHDFFYHCAEELRYCEETVQTRRGVLEGFYDYCQLEEDPEISAIHVEAALTKEILRLCPEGFEREAISRDELDLLYENAGSEINRLIIQFTYETGGRNSDICYVRLNDVDLDKKRVRFRDSKGGKDYSVPIRNELVIKLRQWIHTGRVSRLDQRESEFLFPGPRTDRLRPDYLRKIVKDAAKSAGIQEVIYERDSPTGKRETKRVTPHTLRHSVITHLANDQVDVKYRQLLAGHSKASTTENIYTHDDETSFDILRSEIKS